LPELPEVEAVRRALRPVMEGARFKRVEARRPDLRTPFPRHFTTRLEGQTIRALDRRGKYLMAALESGDVLVMHLGMSGSFRIEQPKGTAAAAAFYDERGSADAHDHVVFEMSSGAVVIFNDPRRFGFMDLVTRAAIGVHRALSALGPEPLDPSFDADTLARACRGKKTSLKAALSDQRMVAGLGNIYVCEALHQARLSPRRAASTIATRTGAPREAAVRLAAAIKSVLNAAIARGETADAGPSRFRVYDREGLRCLRRHCPGVVRRIVQAGRSTFYCPTCQT
jgi:formamidopyrimidine-DNA glycosylase